MCRAVGFVDYGISSCVEYSKPSVADYSSDNDLLTGLGKSFRPVIQFLALKDALQQNL